MKTIKKSLLKSAYYWEFKSLYDTLPEELTVPEYQEHIFTETMTNKEIMEKWEKEPFTPEQAFAVAADYSQKIKKGQWRIVYFRDKEGLPCRLNVWRDGGGQLSLNVDEVNPGREWGAGDGTLVRNENSASLPLDADTLSLENLDARLKKLEALFNPELL